MDPNTDPTAPPATEPVTAPPSEAAEAPEPPAVTRQALDLTLLARGLAASRNKAAKAILSGKVDVNGTTVTRPNTPVRSDAKIHIAWDRAGTGKAALSARSALSSEGVRVVFEDSDLIVFDKPAGLLSDTATRSQAREGRSLRHLAERYLKSRGERPFAVHRIDRDTSGLVVFAKNGAAASRLKDQFADHSALRVYWCAVQGRLSEDGGVLEHWMAWDPERNIQHKVPPGTPGGVLASATWRTLARVGGVTVVEVRLHTGRRNQIRLHWQLEGTPLVGERQYIGRERQAAGPNLQRQALHAKRLGFRHPSTGADLRFDAPLPKDLAVLGRKPARRRKPQAKRRR